jgi:hypothetical protein
MNPIYVDREKLEVKQIATHFAAWSEILLEDCKGKATSAKKHLDEAPTLLRVGVHWPLLDGATDRGRLATLRS